MRPVHKPPRCSLTLSPLTELIGEEIYDEFDPEGSGIESQAFVPPGVPVDLKEKQPQYHKSHSASSLIAKSSQIAMAPALGGAMNMSSATDKTLSPGGVGASLVANTQPGVIGGSAPRPAGLSGFKSLGLFRSKSVPTTPKEEKEGNELDEKYDNKQEDERKK